MRLTIIALLSLAFCATLTAAPVTESTEVPEGPVMMQEASVESAETVATENVLQATAENGGADFDLSSVLFGDTVYSAWSGCREPSPCNTHADCAFPAGFCLPDLANPGQKSCACL